ncbi:hypothetical protein CHISP_2545 [Chitinispirillum alkaliphilum]|nr:hypothetical protein CHISP_2545 [Chitinispirillum alkaliphilum]
MSKRELIDKFVMGTITPEELRDLDELLCSDPFFKAELESSIEFEALCLEAGYFEKAETVADAALLELSPSRHSLSPNTDEVRRAADLFTDSQWDSMIQNAIAHGPVSDKHNNTNWFPFFHFKSFLVAASLILVFVSILSVMKGNKETNALEQHAFQYIRERELPKTDSAEKTILSLGHSTAALVQKQTEILPEKQATDSIKEIALSSGSALFNVNRKHYKRFSVITPHADITVTGTVFRVCVDEYGTEVKVQSGSVLVKHLQRGETVTLLERQSLLLTKDSLYKDLYRFSIEEIEERKLLDGFLRKTTSRMGVEISDSTFLHNINTGLTEKSHLEKAKCKLASGDTLTALSYLLDISKNDTSAHNRGYALFTLLGINDYCQYNLNRDSLFDHFIENHSDFKYADKVLFDYATYITDYHNNYQKAMKLYQFLAGKYPQSSLKEEAIYQAGWCWIQSRMPENRLDPKNIKQFSPDKQLYR